MKSPALILLILLALAAVAQAAFDRADLPAYVASHFNAAGYADAWMPRARFFRIQVLLALGLPAFFVLLALFTYHLPAMAISLPHKERWLAPTQVLQTRRRLASLVLITGCGVAAFLGFIHQRVFQANVDGTHRLSPSPGVILAIALLLIVGPAIIPLISFWRRPPPAN